MTGAKKNITAFTLLLLVALPLLVSIAYTLQKRYVQHQMKEQLEKASLQTLLLQPDQLHWAKAGKELWVNNQLFDVKDIQLTNKGYLIQGLFDTQETAINQKAAQQSDAQSNGAQLALQCLVLALYPPTENVILLPIPTAQQQQQYGYYQSDIHSISLGVITPPPNMA
jgi:hypothetical protein